MIKKKNNNLFYFCSTFYFYIRFREWQNLDLSIFLLLIFTYFNSKSTAGGIWAIENAYEYVMNRRFATEWIIEQYQVETDKKSGIIDDKNDYSDDEMYFFNLLLIIINESIQTVDLINSLPEF